MTPLLIATTNAGKLREIRALLDGLPLRLVTLGDVARMPDPDENGLTFAENASIKARYYATATGLLTVADDSGLEIDALDGLPGVHSARFQGETYAQKFQNLFRMMDERGAPESSARFVCALALARGQDILFEADGRVEGVLVREPRGTGGFGYDPIFLFPSESRTLAELSQEEKARVSHRGAAFRKLRDFMERRELAF